jgi:hypothetical protein
MSTANDFWREREGKNFWSCWLSFSRQHICIHLLNILTNILFKYDTVRASPTRVQQKFANEQDGTKRMFFVVAGRRAKVLK